MSGSMHHWPAPVSAEDLDHCATIARRRNTLSITGNSGSGRTRLAEELATLLLPTSPVWKIRALPEDGGHRLQTLRYLDLAAVIDPDVSAHQLTTKLREALPPRLSVIVQDAEFADASSLRVFDALSRQGRTAVYYVSRSSLGIDIPTFAMPDVSSEVLREVVARRLGAEPLKKDVQWLLSASSGSYRSIRWLVDTWELNQNLRLSPGFAAFGSTTDITMSAWELSKGLSGSAIGRFLAVLRETKPEALRELVGSDALADAEDDLHVFLDPGTGMVSFVGGEAVGMDILLRTGPERLRLIIAAISRAVENGLVLAPSAAARFSAIAASSEPARDALRSAADYDIDEGNDVQSLLEHMRAGDSIAVKEQLMTILSSGDLAGMEAAGIALALAEFRYGSDSPASMALDYTIAIVSQAAEPSGRILRSYRALLRRQGQDAVILSDPPPPETLTESRALQVAAARDLIDGRPSHAFDLLARAQQIEDKSALDEFFVRQFRVLCLLAASDLSQVKDSISTIAPGDTDPNHQTLFWAFIEIREGSVGVGYSLLLDLLPGLENNAPTYYPVIEAVAAFCAAALGDATTSSEHLKRARSRVSPSPLVEPFRLFAIALASSSLAKIAVLPALDAEEAWLHAKREAHRADLHALELLCDVPLIRMNADRQPEMPSEDVTFEAYDGVLALYDRLRRAQLQRDERAVAKVALDLSALGLSLESKAVAASVPTSDLPRDLARAIRRLQAQPTGVRSHQLLTPRELEVARLVALRATDSEVAGNLGISTKTASVHVGRILMKLGIKSRHDIAQALDDLEG